MKKKTIQLKKMFENIMAEGTSFENPTYEPDPWDNDDYDQEVDTTRPFRPGEASTPYYGGEQYEMQTMMHEQSGLPDTSYEETPFLGYEAQNSWDALTRLFLRANAINLETSVSKTGRLQVRRSGVGKKSYPLFTKDKISGKDRLNPQLTKEIKDSLGGSAEEIIAEDRDTIREQRQRLAEAEIQQRQAEALAAERENHAQEMQTLGQQIETKSIRRHIREQTLVIAVTFRY